SPSKSTVQPPHAPRSQISFAPVRSRWFRSARSSVTRGSTFTVLTAPLIFKLRGTGPGPSTAAPAGIATPARLVAAAPTPAVLRKVRRETTGAAGSSLSEGWAMADLARGRGQPAPESHPTDWEAIVPRPRG